MDARLTQSADRQAAAESLKEKILNFGRVSDGPDSIAVKAN
jgi:hypothetical protein